MYGAAVNGLRPHRLRDLRRIQGSVARVRGGGSLTARLALGGEAHRDTDPSTYLLVPPLLHIIRLIWDAPQARHGIILAWRRADNLMQKAPLRRCWSYVIGPVSAAYAQLREIGAPWTHPLTITLLDYPVNLLEVPPPSRCRRSWRLISAGTLTARSLSALPSSTIGMYQRLRPNTPTVWTGSSSGKCSTANWAASTPRKGGLSNSLLAARFGTT